VENQIAEGYKSRLQSERLIMRMCVSVGMQTKD